MKFFSILKKEIKELMTIQTIMGLLISLFAFYIIGGFMGDVMTDLNEDAATVTICDQDNREIKTTVISTIEAQNNKINLVTLESDDYQAELKRLDITELIVIPKGFSDTVFKQNKKAELEYISVMDTISMSGNISRAGSSMGYTTIEDAVKTTLMNYKGLTTTDITLVQDPVELKETTIVGEKSAEVSSNALSGFLSTQGVFVPIVIFILVIYASQMIIAAIATEKVDKTLETLLSAPVSRISVLAAKMIAAALIAALNAIVYMFGFSKFMGGITSGVSTEGDNVGTAVTQLGLKLQGVDYVFLGMQMFLTILIALSISLVLGALAKDVKSAQTLILPIMFMAMIPYMLSMFVDISTLSIIPRTLIYAIPFTHTFIAIDNIIFAKDALFWGGFAYQVVFLIICMFFAVRVFMTDKLFTITLSLGKKRKFFKK